jgi:hypothetical protein
MEIEWIHVVIVVFSVVLMMLWFKQRTEFFVPKPKEYNATIEYKNIGPDVHERHPMQVSVLEDVKSKYQKTYNYEFENAEYESALRKTFNVAKDRNTSCIASNEWNPVVVAPSFDSEQSVQAVQTVYTFAVEYISDRIKESEHFQLPDNLDVKLNPIQTLHDVLISYQSHTRLPSYILTLQFVFYREAKYQAKDVGMTVYIDKTKGRYTLTVLDVWINGVIFEDKIGLFPVAPTDPFNAKVTASKATFSDQHPSQYLKKGYEFCGATNLDAKTAMLCVDSVDMSVLDHNQVIL